MLVLVTGARGFVGRHVAAEFERRGASVLAVDRDEADVCDAEAVARVVARALPDAVVHLAAQSRVAASFADPAGTLRANVLGTVAVLEAVRAHAPRARVVVASSAEVYGSPRAEELPLDELAPLAPVNPYGASKVAQEAVALQYARGLGVDALVVRVFNAIGPGQSTDFALPGWAAQLAAISRGEAPPVLRVGNLAVERDLVDVRDVARAYAALVDHGVRGGVYNVCTGEPVALSRIVDLLVGASGVDVRVEVDAARLRPVDAPRLVGCNAHLRRTTRWAPEVPLERTLADLYAFAGSDQ